ncbi:hypothetical protein, partial [Sedimentibacter sp. B4]|uniref:hypothetical protein n=1 Tax=Sedimentibacter sp. B4 TaxID=304766 RepID=UPI001E4CF02D
NPGDFAIRKDVARSFADRVFALASIRFGEALVDPELKWMHDFVDPLSRAPARPNRSPPCCSPGSARAT